MDAVRPGDISGRVPSDAIDLNASVQRGGTILGMEDASDGEEHVGVKRPRRSDALKYIQVAPSKRPWVLRSVIKVFVVKASPNYAQPWQMRVQRSAVGSAFVVSSEKRQIITNAHVVSGQHTIHVRRPGDPLEDGFWDGIQAVKWIDVPELQKGITVVGYPVGGESLSITQGIVSRVTMSPYATGASSLINIQIDAAINPGNSGGPAFSSLEEGTVAGMAYSRHKSAEGTGYIIPYCVVRHFLEEHEQNSYFRGICCLGLRWQKLENPGLRAYHQMKDDQTGVLVYDINSLSPAHEVVRVGDVLMSINGEAISDDGTVEFRNDERIDASHVVRGRHVGEEVELKLLRDGTEQIVHYKLQAASGGLMPGLHGVDCWPSYLMFGVPLVVQFAAALASEPPLHYKQTLPCHSIDNIPLISGGGGLVFVPLSLPYLEHLFGARNWRSVAPADVLSLSGRYCEFKGQSVVVLSQVLAADINFGYSGGFGCVRCCKFNGVEINNLKHLAELIAAATTRFVKLEMYAGPMVVLEREEAIASGPLILRQNAIAEDRSSDLKEGAPSPLLADHPIDSQVAEKTNGTDSTMTSPA